MYHYFETPYFLVYQMLERARIPVDIPVQILEPSAGRGRIAKIVQTLRPNAVFTIIEKDETNCKQLKSLGFSPIQKDFLEFKTTPSFDRVLMNPPFEKVLFIQHIQHAFPLLRDGGILVSILPRNHNLELPATKSREEFYIPDGAFTYQGTILRTKMLVVEK